MKLAFAATILALVALAVAQSADFTCPSTYKPKNSCTAGPCRCAEFQVVRIQTTKATATTEIIIRVTNYCNQSVYYAQFGLDRVDNTKPLTLVSPLDGATYASGNGAYSWGVSVVDGRAQGTSPAITWIRFTANPNPNYDFMNNSTKYDYETFRFVVSNYDPTFPWYFQLHQGGNWDTFGPLDMSMCACTNCDAGAAVRVIEPCVLGYPDQSSNLATSIFNEDEILYSFQIEGNKLELFYADEHPLSLGIRKVTALDKSDTLYPVSPRSSTPRCVSGSALQFGAWNFDGHDQQANIDGNAKASNCVEDAAGVKPTCGRPIPPALFVTDITADPTNRNGDWQQGGRAYPAQKVCGIWKHANKTITGSGDVAGVYAFTLNPEATVGTPNGDSRRWDFGAGSDPLPVGFVTTAAANAPKDKNKWGAEVMWDLDLLNLNPASKYRFQFTVHDGDQTRVGGDVGEACIIASSACPAGFTGPTCQQCDLNPLPYDNSYTWYCFPTGANTSANAYQLIKIPTSKLTDPLYAQSGGFKIGNGIRDGKGYFVTCDCQRIITPCDSNCCGHGICNDAIGVCGTCDNPQEVPDANCCPTINVTQTCFNDGLYCSGNGRCVSGQCVCNAGSDGTADWEGAACNISVIKRKRCDQLPATDCQSCLDAAAANGVYCGWCTSRTPGTQAALDTGRCSEDLNCQATPGAAYPNNVTNLGVCFITAVYVPEPCPDNCTGHGTCENKTTSSSGASAGNSSNATQVCVCTGGYTGLNCGEAPIAALVGGISAGIIAGIVIAIIAFLAIAGGGAYAAAQAMNTGSAAPVTNNPLYRGQGNQGVNPLYKA